jgi:hypothetical protein
VAINAAGLRDQRLRVYRREDAGAEGFSRPVFVFDGEWWGRLDAAPASTRTGQQPMAAYEMQSDARATVAYEIHIPADGMVYVDGLAFLVRGVVRDRLLWRTEITLARVASDTVTISSKYDTQGELGGYHLVDPSLASDTPQPVPPVVPSAFAPAFDSLAFA